MARISVQQRRAVFIGGTPLMKTAQVNIYGTGDAADLQTGREVNFFNLNWIHFFGHSKRFTGVSGGYFDEVSGQYKDVNGNVTNSTGSFPNGVMIDWSQFDVLTGNFMMYDLTLSNDTMTWDEARVWSLQTGKGYNNWRPPNWKEAAEMINDSFVFALQWQPYVTFNQNIWTSSTPVAEPNSAKVIISVRCSVEVFGKLNTFFAMKVRTGNITEL